MMGVEYRPGDTIRLEHDDGSALVRRVDLDDGGVPSVCCPGGVSADVSYLTEIGWRVVSVERKPDPLPTVEGFYVGCDGETVLKLDGDGKWWVGCVVCGYSKAYAGDLRERAPLTRLVRESEKADAWDEGRAAHVGYVASNPYRDPSSVEVVFTPETAS